MLQIKRNGQTIVPYSVLEVDTYFLITVNRIFLVISLERIYFSLAGVFHGRIRHFVLYNCAWLNILLPLILLGFTILYKTN